MLTVNCFQLIVYLLIPNARFPTLNLMSDATIWKDETLADHYLSGVRGAIPLANTQIDMMLRLVDKFVPQVERFLDLGCGDGILGRQILDHSADSEGLFLDFSQAMIAAAGIQLEAYGARAERLVFDYGDPAWVEQPAVVKRAPYDLILSGFSIHHQPDGRKREIYQEIFDLLRPGGLFLNLEHVSSPTPEIESLFDEQFIDHLTAYHARIDSGKDRQQVADELYNRPDKAANILLDVETQCDWLREIGYQQVDCYFKCFELGPLWRSEKVTN